MHRWSWVVVGAVALSWAGASQGAVAQDATTSSRVPVAGVAVGSVPGLIGGHVADNIGYAVHSIHRVEGGTVLYFSVKALPLTGSAGESDVTRAVNDRREKAEAFYTASPVSLLDVAGGKQYRVLSEGPSGCLCSKTLDLEDRDASRWQVMYATFPKLPKDLTSVAVDVNGSGAVVMDVPVTDDPLPTPQVPESVALTGEGWPKPPSAATLKGKDFFGGDPVWALASRYGLVDGSMRREEAGSKQSLQVNADVLFAYGKAEITPKAKKALDDVAAQLKDAKVTRAQVVGHTDDTGDEAFNQTLSQLRAKAVEAELAKRLDGVTMSTSGKGETQPIATNKTEQGQALNRRVEISFEAEED